MLHVRTIIDEVKTLLSVVEVSECFDTLADCLNKQIPSPRAIGIIFNGDDVMVQNENQLPFLMNVKLQIVAKTTAVNANMSGCVELADSIRDACSSHLIYKGSSGVTDNGNGTKYCLLNFEYMNTDD